MCVGCPYVCVNQSFLSDPFVHIFITAIKAVRKLPVSVETKALNGWTDPLAPDIISNGREQGSGIFQDDGDH